VRLIGLGFRLDADRDSEVFAQLPLFSWFN
jgi:hypothetical protein